MMQNFYISFGQVHVHSVNGTTFDKDCLALIRAEDADAARAKAHELFGPKWAFEYTEERKTTLKPEYYPRGVFEVE